MTVRLCRFPTHTDPPPTATGPGLIPTGIAPTIWFVSGSMIPTWFAPTASPSGRRATRQHERDGGNQHRESEGCCSKCDRTSPQRRSDCRLCRLSQVTGGLQRRELRRQPVSTGLVDANRAIEVLEAVLPEVTQEDVEILFLVLEQRLRRLGHKHLAAVPGRADAGGTVDGQSGVAGLTSGGLACVDPHSNLDVHGLWPLVGEERKLSFDGSKHRLARAREGDEEGIALRVDLVAAVSRERCAQQPLMLGEHPLVPVAELLHEPRRPLDVREQEGDGAARTLRLAHRGAPHRELAVLGSPRGHRSRALGGIPRRTASRGGYRRPRDVLAAAGGECKPASGRQR